MIVPQLVLALFWVRSQKSEVKSQKSGREGAHVGAPNAPSISDLLFSTFERQTACKPGSVLP